MRIKLLKKTQRITHRRVKSQDFNNIKNDNNRSCKRQLTYMFSGDMVNSLWLITDLHKMIQLIKKLLTGTMNLNKNFIQSRLRNIHIQYFKYIRDVYRMCNENCFNSRTKMELKVKCI